MSQLELECTGKINQEGEIKYGGWIPVEFKYNNSDKPIIFCLGEGDKLCYGENKYIIKNDNCQELYDKYRELMYNINEDIGRRDELFPANQ